MIPSEKFSLNWFSNFSRYFSKTTSRFLLKNVHRLFRVSLNNLTNSIISFLRNTTCDFTTNFTKKFFGKSYLDCFRSSSRDSLKKSEISLDILFYFPGIAFENPFEFREFFIKLSQVFFPAGINFCNFSKDSSRNFASNSFMDFFKNSSLH